MMTKIRYVAVSAISAFIVCCLPGPATAQDTLEICDLPGVGDVGYQATNDWDDDGIADSADTCPFAYDLTKEAELDAGLDDGGLETGIVSIEHADNDGVSDPCDNCPVHDNVQQLDRDGDGIGDACDNDADGDLVLDTNDNCPDTYNPGQEDIDDDEIGDSCDGDIDGDGLANQADDCPFGTSDMDSGVEDGGVTDGGTGVDPDDLECFGDPDGDAVGSFTYTGSETAPLDNCANVANPDQEDMDLDGAGDLCDPDLDGDGVANSADNCPQLPNEDQADTDRDLIGDACEMISNPDDWFCFVVLGDVERCLDPTDIFSVYSPSVLNVVTGDELRVRLFANREDVDIAYQWYVVAGPESSLKNGAGEVSCSTPFEYHYAEDLEPTFAPTVPGIYVLYVNAAIVGTDPVTGQLNPTAGTEVTFEVSGPQLNYGSDCACHTAGHGSMGLPAILLLLAVCVAWFTLRRARR